MKKSFTIEIPMAEGRDEEGGWTVSCQFCRDIAEKTQAGDAVCEEQAEEVLMALFGIPRNSKSLPGEPQFG